MSGQFGMPEGLLEGGGGVDLVRQLSTGGGDHGRPQVAGFDPVVRGLFEGRDEPVVKVPLVELSVLCCVGA